MKVAVIGATGFVGSHIVRELADRGMDVLGISRKEKEPAGSNLRYLSCDVLQVNELADAIRGCDVVVSAYNPGWGNPDIYEDFLKGSSAIQQAVKLAGVERFIVIGGAGSLYVAEGVQAVDTEGFPPEIRPGASAARDYLNILKQETELDWAFFSPAFEMHAGITTGRTGQYRLGIDYPVMSEAGRSILSGEDLAVVIADEIETPRHHRMRFTAAY